MDRLEGSITRQSPGTGHANNLDGVGKRVRKGHEFARVASQRRWHSGNSLPACVARLIGGEGLYHLPGLVSYRRDCPSEYFRPDVERPANLGPHLLDFTYLFQDGVENPAFTTMGEGRRIREPDESEQSRTAASLRAARMFATEVPLKTTNVSCKQYRRHTRRLADERAFVKAMERQSE